jgi:RNA polymerase sigma-70 factor (ECF subfamily)
MSNNVNYLELVRQAQLGGQESMNRLAQLVKGRVCAYIYRLTLNYDLSQDLQQETLLEMVKSLKSLRFEHTNQFWSWLYRTALSKVQLHFRDQRHKRTVQMTMVEKEQLSERAWGDYDDGLNSMIRKELSEAVLEAMEKMKFRQRNVLVLRCFERMPYSEIATIMNCSEMAAQVLFHRAKRSLKRQLSKHSFGKGFLLIALGLFARMTTPAGAPSVTTTVTVTSTKVGLAATVFGAVGTKLGMTVAIVTTAAIFTAGNIIKLNDNNISSASKVGFEYPSNMVDAYDPDGDGWQGNKGRDVHLIPIVPEKWLVGAPRSNQSAVVLPVGHWIELKFRDKIVDGPGDDILLIEWDANGEQAGVFVTDGVGNEYWLGMAMAGTSGQPTRTEIGFDISDISLPFVPCAVRIVGIKEGGTTPGFDLYSVRARIYVSQGDY